MIIVRKQSADLAGQFSVKALLRDSRTQPAGQKLVVLQAGRWGRPGQGRWR